MSAANSSTVAPAPVINGVTPILQTNSALGNPRAAKPPPTGPAPSVPPTTQSNGHPPHPHLHPHPHVHGHPHTHTHTHPGARLNGAQKGKKKVEAPLDPATMYETVKNRIAALEEEEVVEEEEERRFAEEAQTSVKGMEENGVHTKYIELFAELKRMERDHAKEKQKLVKDKDAAKSQLTKANQTRTKMENLARELQKDNKRLREDGKRLAQCVEDAQDEIQQMKSDISKRADKAKVQDVKFREMPDILVKVVCRYRAELFFKISRKTKLSRLFNAWTERMETGGTKKTEGGASNAKPAAAGKETNGTVKSDAITASNTPPPSMRFVFTHNGRSVDAEQTPEEAGMEDGDEILAVELMDLTEGGGDEAWEHLIAPKRQRLKKNWTENPKEAKKAMEEIFDGVVRERLKEVLRQYELRERHFECVIRSKELEVLLSRARAAEQKQLAEGEKLSCQRAEEENQRLRSELENAKNGQSLLIDKLITCCKEPTSERTQRLFASLRDELEKRGTKLSETPANGVGE